MRTLALLRSLLLGLALALPTQAVASDWPEDPDGDEYEHDGDEDGDPSDELDGDEDWLPDEGSEPRGDDDDSADDDDDVVATTDPPLEERGLGGGCGNDVSASSRLHAPAAPALLLLVVALGAIARPRRRDPRRSS